MTSDGTRNTRTLWQSYTNLPARTRMYFGLAVGLTGAIGLVVADRLQEIFPADRREADAPQPGSGVQHPAVVPQKSLGE